MSLSERARELPLILCAAILAIVAGAGIAASPAIGLGIAFGPIFLVLLLRVPAVRLAWFIVGGMLVFGGSSGVGAPKLGYFAGVLLVAAISWTRVARSKADWLVPFRPILPATIVVMVALALSAVVAHGDATPLNWVRDVLGYALLACAPVIALDAAHELNERFLHRMIGALGLAAAVGFASDWLNRRGVSALPFGRILLASGSPAALALGLAVAKIAARQSPRAWAFLAAAIPSIMLTTGTRSLFGWSIVLFGVIGSRRKHRMGPGKALVIALLAGAGIAFLATQLAGLIGDSSFFSQRIGAAISVVRGGGQDQSYGARQVAYGYGHDTWAQHRWTGVGPGHLFGGLAFTLDSPLVTLAKFGILGTTVLVGFLVVLLGCGGKAAHQFGWSPVHTAVRCYALVILADVPFGSPFEDKGFSFAVCLSMAALAVSARTGSIGDGMGELEVIGKVEVDFSDLSPSVVGRTALAAP